MQIVYHMGVHGTDGDRMLKTLLNNRDWLHRNQIETLTPNRYRGIFDEAMTSLQGGAATPEMEQIMLDAILESDDCKRMICSMPAFMGVVTRAISAAGLYATAPARLAALANLFPSAESEFFVALKNPVTLLQSLNALSNRSYEQMMANVDPLNLRWAPLLRNMVQAAQGRRLVVWRHEDVPLIWPEIVRLIADMPAAAPLKDAMIYIHSLLDDAGQSSLTSVLAGRDQLSITDRREICIDHMAAYAVPNRIEEEVTMPGWTQDMVDEVTRLYYIDTDEIAVLPGVEYILP